MLENLLYPEGRAWIGLDAANLKHNVQAVRAVLPEGCQLIAVVKGNGYGHGAPAVARELAGLGVRYLAVATLAEALELRENNVDSEILILGHTHPADAALLQRFDLTQTVAGRVQGEQLNAQGHKIKVHIKIETGMHRIGTDYRATGDLEHFFELENLDIRGMYSHFCVADLQDDDSRRFTRQQAANFDRALATLRQDGFDPGLCHIQASYGVLNHSDLCYDAVRPGTLIYGVDAEFGLKGDIDLGLKPVLSLRARVTSVRDLAAGETVGYGRAFTAAGPTKIASVGIGYADGYPRTLSRGQGRAMIAGQFAPVAGMVCMDQLMLDVTGLPEVQPGDLVTFIGQDGNQMISAEEVAGQAGMLIPELFSGFSRRLQRFFVR